MRWVIWGMVVGLAACDGGGSADVDAPPGDGGPDARRPDAGRPDAAPPDAAARLDALVADGALPDAAHPDAMPADASPTDAAPQDAMPADASPMDAAPQDAMPADASPADAVPGDAAPSVDAEPDATPSVDAAPSDAEPADLGPIPPDLAELAPDHDPSVATGLAASVAFLYAGPNPVQRDVEAGAIAGRRIAVLRGRVLDRAGDPLAAVRVHAPAPPELGWTATRANGAYGLVVNGGGRIRLRFAAEGFLPAERGVNTAWQAQRTVPDVVLVPLDPAVTAIDLLAADAVQVARGTEIEDEDGARRATLLFPADTCCCLTLPGGDVVPLDRLSVRATEYTVGEAGPSAMPADLPARSA